MSTRSYRDAIDSLNTLQSNTATLAAARASGGRSAEIAMHETEEYLDRIGYRPEDLNSLNVLHVTGTKGKGSTCAFIDSLLRHAMPEWTVGLYTSPHLVAVRERIRINGKPISEEDFAKYFFQVWDRLEQNDTRKLPETSPKPMYFRMVTMVAFHAFMEMKVDATVLEVGVGGLHDCTNVVPKPIVTGITALGLDHVPILGTTIEHIAFQKGGIFKEGVVAMTVDQPTEAMRVLEQQAKDRKASSFTVMPIAPDLSNIKLGLAGIHQYQNASLAVNMTREFLAKQAPAVSPAVLPKLFDEALQTAKWPGRCQTVSDPRNAIITWYLDGAHTIDSLECSMQWFVTPGVGLKDTSMQPTRVLVFNCTQGRNGNAFLGCMLAKVQEMLRLHAIYHADAKTFFDHVIFSTNVTYASGGFKADLTSLQEAEASADPCKLQRELSAAWSALVPEFPAERIHVLPSIEHVVNVVRDLETSAAEGEQIDVLVAGSLHLVGGVIEAAGLSDVAL